MKKNILYLALLALIFIISFNMCCQAVPMVKSGAWTWFNYPVAIHYKGKYDRTYYGFVGVDGGIRVSSYDHKQKVNVSTFELGKFEVDDHNNPAVQVLDDGNIIVFYSRHNKDNNLRYRITTIAEDISTLGPEQILESPTGKVTYAQAVVYQERIVVFYRVSDRYWAIRISENSGKIWGDEKKFLDLGEGQKAYIKISQRMNPDVHYAVDIIISGHPDNDSDNNIYYAYLWLDNGEIRIPEGYIDNINTLKKPLTQNQLMKAYEWRENEAKVRIWDVYSLKNKPALAFSKIDSQEEHSYYYAIYNPDKNKFDVSYITSAGGTISDEREISFSGGMSFIKEKDNWNIIYISREINGKWEIEEWRTPDNGINWMSRPITKNSYLDNVRPMSVVDSHPSLEVLWMHGAYQHYTEYITEINGNN